MIIGLYLFLPFIANGLKMLNDARLLSLPLGSHGRSALRCEVTVALAAAHGETA